MAEDPIFRFKEVLTPNYTPDHLPHREKELKTISSLISGVLHNHIINVFVYGPPGTGKTASIKFIFQKLKKEANVLPVYLNCFRINTRMAALYFVFEEFFKRVKLTRRMPSRRGIGYDELFDALYSEIKKSKTKLIVCLDEVDHLLPKGSEVLYDLSRLKEECLHCQIIAISNDKSVLSGLDPRIMSSMHPLEYIHFRPYGFEEMREIIKARVEAAFQPDVVEKEAIDFLAKYTADKGGDVRIARETLFRAGELARKKGSKKVTVEHIEAVLGETKFSKIQSMISQLSEQEKSILKLIPEKGISYPGFSLFYEQYYPDSIKDRMLRNYLEKLERLGLVKLEIKGAGGAYWITLNVPRKVVEESI
jgi:cell division control protein 6